MKEIDVETIAKTAFKSIKDLKSTLIAQKAKTTNLGFILNLRKMFLKYDEPVVATDMFLWDLMRDHDSIQIETMSFFLVACHEGSVDWFLKLLPNAKKDDKDISGHTAPFHAMMSGNLFILKKLKGDGFDFINVSKNKKSLLKESASSKNPEVFKWLLEQTEDHSVLEDALTDHVLHHDNYEVTKDLLSKGVNYENCRVKTDKFDLELSSIAIYRKRFKALQAILDSNVQATLPFDSKNIAETVSALHSDVEEPSIDQTIDRNYALFLIEKTCKGNKSVIAEYITHAKSAEDINFICSYSDVLPMFDLDIDAFELDIQNLIYEAMVI